MCGLVMSSAFSGRIGLRERVLESVRFVEISRLVSSFPHSPSFWKKHVLEESVHFERFDGRRQKDRRMTANRDIFRSKTNLSK